MVVNRNPTVLCTVSPELQTIKIKTLIFSIIDMVAKKKTKQEEPRTRGRNLSPLERGYLTACFDFRENGDNDYTDMQIAKQLNEAYQQNRSRRCVTHFFKRLRTPPKKNKPQRGRPRLDEKYPKLTFLIKREVVSNGRTGRCRTAEDIASQLRAEGIEVSASTVTRRLEDEGFRRRVQANKPKLTERHKRLRLIFARYILSLRKEDLRNIVYVDETYKCRNYITKKQFCWRRSDERYSDECVNPTERFPMKINIISGVSSRGVLPLLRLEGRMNMKKMKKVLMETIIPGIQDDLTHPAPFFLYHDNSSPYRGSVCRKYIEKLQGKRVLIALQPPPNSPDLNIIESFWAWLEKETRDRDCRTKAELEKVLQDAWKTCPKHLCRAYTKSIRRRCEDVIKNGGGYIDC